MLFKYLHKSGIGQLWLDLNGVGHGPGGGGPKHLYQITKVRNLRTEYSKITYLVYYVMNISDLQILLVSVVWLLLVSRLKNRHCRKIRQARVSGIEWSKIIANNDYFRQTPGKPN